MSLMECEEFGIEKIIQELQEAVDLGDAPKRGPFGVFVRKEYLVETIALLRTHPDNQPNEPLTLEELREMDDFVWVCYPQATFGPNLPPADYLPCSRYKFSFSEYGKTWIAYRRPPKEA